METDEQPQKPFGIRSEIDSLREEISMVHQTVDHLSDKLAPIRTNDPEPMTESKMETFANTELGGSVRDIRETLRNLNTKLSDIASTVEI